MTGSVECVVVGAGVVGLAIARALVHDPLMLQYMIDLMGAAGLIQIMGETHRSGAEVAKAWYVAYRVSGASELLAGLHDLDHQVIDTGPYRYVRHPGYVAALLLTLFGVLGTSLVAFTHEQTRERIQANERQALLRSLQALVPASEVDNDMAGDSLLVHAPELLGSPETRGYRGRKGGEPVAIAGASANGMSNTFPKVSPDGKWMVYISFPSDINPNDHPFCKRVELKLMPVAGGPARVIAYLYGGQGTINVPSLSPDSSWLPSAENAKQ